MVDDAFAEVGLPRAPVVDEAALARRFDALSRERHPDAGGDATAFARLTEARAVLASPARRWRHLLELEFPGTRLDGPLSPELMDLFTQLGPALQEAKAVLARREQAATALARALISNDQWKAREALEEQAATLAARLATLEESSGATTPPAEVLASLAREAGFVEKWRAQTRAMLAALMGEGSL